MKFTVFSWMWEWRWVRSVRFIYVTPWRRDKYINCSRLRRPAVCPQWLYQTIWNCDSLSARRTQPGKNYTDVLGQLAESRLTVYLSPSSCTRCSMLAFKLNTTGRRFALKTALRWYTYMSPRHTYIHVCIRTHTYVYYITTIF